MRNRDGEVGGGRRGWPAVQPTDWDDSRREIFPFGRSRPTRDGLGGRRKNFGGERRQYCVGYHISLSRYGVPGQSTSNATDTIDKLLSSTHVAVSPRLRSTRKVDLTQPDPRRPAPVLSRYSPISSSVTVAAGRYAATAQQTRPPITLQPPAETIEPEARRAAAPPSRPSRASDLSV